MDWNITMDHKTARARPKASHYEAHTPDTGLQLLTYRECAARLALTRDALRKMVSRGEVPADAIVKIGTRVRFKAPAIDAWIDSLSRGAQHMVRITCSANLRDIIGDASRPMTARDVAEQVGYQAGDKGAA